ncbi:hypothetical protein BV22DRAFT_1116996 [Leucogyrophana mollusca]|uniref:Uncharacterized protein n=1 Tax=Leucogyrophana mollusca TaxID=85980 RepID=A0ACB8BW11_9AGAM|nr:hypothetical protein BV22DRAFT_1116996 [Leucogyrophana mollusca]
MSEILPESYHVELKEGVSGGLAGSLFSNGEYQITKALDSTTLQIRSSSRPLGTSSFTETEPKVVPSDVGKEKLLELFGILKSLAPPPPGSGDVFGEGKTISWFSNEFMWSNNISGAIVGEDKRSPEEVEKFKRAVEVVSELAEL